MSKLTPVQLVAIETDGTYKDNLRMAVLATAIYYKGLNAPATLGAADSKTWFIGRQLAESLLAQPNISIDRQYWASKSLTALKDMDIPGITDASTVAEINTALLAPINAPSNMGTRYGSLAEATYNEEVKKISF